MTKRVWILDTCCSVQFPKGACSLIYYNLLIYTNLLSNLLLLQSATIRNSFLASPLSHGAHRSTVDCTLNSDGMSNLVGHCANAAWPWPSPSEQVTALAQGRLQLREEKQHAIHVAVCQNLVPLVNIKIAGKWMFIPLKMVLIGIDPYPCF